MLALVFGAAAVLLLSAPALSAPPPLSAEQVAVGGGNVQHSPAIAINPANPLQAVVTADDGAPAAPPGTASGATANWTGLWAVGGALQYPGGTASAGQADVAWSAAGTQDVYVVALGTTTAGGPTSRNLCSPSSGIFFSHSDDAGATYDTAIPVDTGSSSSEVVEPAIATSGTNVYIAYTELRWADAGCSGSPDSATTFMIASPDGGDTWPTVPRRASPFALTGLYRSPAITALPDGRAIIAFRNDSGAVARIETEVCNPAPGVVPFCGAGTAQVGPSTIVGDAAAPSTVTVGGMVGAAAPSIVAAGGRVVVAWHAAVDAGVRAFAALSTDNGVTFGPPQQIDASGAGNQLDPRLAATAGGRVDAAYLWDSGLGGVQATVASANPPLAGASTEAWARPVVVQSVPAFSLTGIPGQSAPLGRRLGVATADAGVSPLPATVVAFTNTRAGQDVHVTGLLHGMTVPTVGAQTVRASKNATTVVTVTGNDDDGDPLTWSVGGQPSDAGSSVSVADSSRGTFNFRAADKVGLETFDAVATDGVAGHETHGTITVSVENDPPEITCAVLSARENERLPIPVSSCVKDPNLDEVAVTLDGAVNGSVAKDTDGTWYFDPTPQSTATGSFILHAVDTEGATAQAKVIVTVSPPTGVVHLTIDGDGKLRTVTSGLALRFGGHAVDAAGRATPVIWDFGDHSPTVRGTAVAHRFRTAGSYKVTATASNASKSIPVVARKRGVEIAGVPHTAGGVMTVRVRTRLPGSLSVRVDSRSQTVAVASGSHVRTLRIQVTTGPLVRLTVRLTPKKVAKAKLLPALTVRRLVLVPPRSAG